MKILILKLSTAVIFSPLILAVLAGTIENGFPFFSENSVPLDYFRFMGLVYYFGFVGSVVIGIPVTLLLRHFQYTNYIYFLLSGFIVVLIYMFIANLFAGSIEKMVEVPVLQSMLLFSSCGAVISSFFWFFIIYDPLKFLHKKKSPLKAGMDH